MENSSCSLGYDFILPEDTIEEILIRLPVKSLVRFKAVSKSWNSIITNPTFAKTQFHHSTTHHVTSSHILLRDDNTIFTLHLDLDNISPNKEIKTKLVPLHPKFNPILENRGFQVLGSCHGMLCVHVLETNDIYIWNPSTNESRLIPWPVSKTFKCFQRKLSRFGYVSSINDYKLVLIARYTPHHFHCHYHESWPLQVHVYSLRQNRWREIGYPVIPPFRFEKSYVETVLLNDALYWTSDYSGTFIVKFDMVNEIFEKVLELDPNGQARRGYSLYFDIGAFGDDHHHKQQLCIYKKFRYFNSYYNDSEPKPDEVEMWVLDGRDDQQNYKWKKKFVLKGRWDNLGDNHKLVKVTGNGKVLIFEREIHSWRTKHTEMVDLLIFDCRDRKGSFIHVKNEYCLPFKCSEPVYDVVNYLRTLISPNNIL